MFAAFINIIIRSGIVVVFKRRIRLLFRFAGKYVVIAFLKKVSLLILPYTLLKSISLMKNVSESNLPVNFKVYNIIQNP